LHWKCVDFIGTRRIVFVENYVRREQRVKIELSMVENGNNAIKRNRMASMDCRTKVSKVSMNNAIKIERLPDVLVSLTRIIGRLFGGTR
jgi:hypothetical protein